MARYLISSILIVHYFIGIYYGSFEKGDEGNVDVISILKDLHSIQKLLQNSAQKIPKYGYRVESLMGYFQIPRSL
jgi:hypothetical protein